MTLDAFSALLSREGRGFAPDPLLLAALLGEAERVIDHQAKAMEELDDKSEHMVGLGVALLAGGLSIATFLIGKDSAPRPDWTFFLLLCAAGAANLAAILAFLESYVGFRHGAQVAVGPSLDWLQTRSLDPTWSLPSHRLSLLSQDGYPAYAQANAETMAHSARARRIGLFLLAAALLLYLAALVEILALTIQGQP